MSSSIKCFTTDRLLSRGSASDSDDEELLGGRLFFGVFGSFTGGLGLFADPLGRPRGRFTGAAGALVVTVDSTDSVESTTCEPGASALASAFTSAAVSKLSNTTDIFLIFKDYFFYFIYYRRSRDAKRQRQRRDAKRHPTGSGANKSSKLT